MKNNELLLGIDDAGRGPVIGPMVLAGCLIPAEMEKEFAELGVMDSKLLTRKKRQILEKVIKEKAISHYAHLITPSEIDTGYGQGLNLNEVEALATGVIINTLIDNLKKIPEKLKIIIDCPSVNIKKWVEILKKYVKYENLEINASHKADFLYPVVSAASIIAKVTRDAEIEKIKKEIGIDFGSGYPADPKTKSFLKKHFNDFKKNNIFRTSWQTYQEVVKKLEQSTFADY